MTDFARLSAFEAAARIKGRVAFWKGVQVVAE